MQVCISRALHYVSTRHKDSNLSSLSLSAVSFHEGSWNVRHRICTKHFCQLKKTTKNSFWILNNYNHSEKWHQNSAACIVDNTDHNIQYKVQYKVQHMHIVQNLKKDCPITRFCIINEISRGQLAESRVSHRI